MGNKVIYASKKICTFLLNVSLIRYCTIAEKAPQCRKKKQPPMLQLGWNFARRHNFAFWGDWLQKKVHIPTANFLGVSRTRHCTLVDCSYKVSVTVALRTPLRLRRQLGSLFATIICRASLQLFVYPLTSRRLNGEIFVVGWHFSWCFIHFVICQYDSL